MTTTPMMIEDLAKVESPIHGLTPLVCKRKGNHYLIFVLKGHHKKRRHRRIGSVGECVPCLKRLNEKTDV